VKDFTIHPVDRSGSCDTKKTTEDYFNKGWVGSLFIKKKKNLIFLYIFITLSTYRIVSKQQFIFIIFISIKKYLLSPSYHPNKPNLDMQNLGRKIFLAVLLGIQFAALKP
jgi:hypothetical protein